MAPKRSHQSAPPVLRSEFKDEGDEIGYLYDTVLYWYYGRDNPEAAKEYADRLVQLLAAVSDSGENVRCSEAWAVAYEVREDWEQAIRWRRREIELILKLQELAKTEAEPARWAILREYGAEGLIERHYLLAIEQWHARKLEDALATLALAESLCTQTEVAFSGRDLRQDILDDVAEQEAKLS